MAFDEKFLDSLGIGKDNIKRILDAYSADTEILRAKADNAASLKKQLAEADEKLSAYAENNYRGKYEAVLAEHENLKTRLAEEKVRNTKLSAYGAALKKAGIPDKRISAVLKITDLDSVDFDDSLALKDEAGEIKKIRNEYAGLIPSSVIVGAGLETPPVSAENKSGRTGIAAQLQKNYQETMYGLQPDTKNLSI